jgi:hypothetical protein
LFGGRLEVGRGISLAGLSLFESAFRDGSLVIEELGAIKLHVGQTFVVLGLDVNLVGARNIGALHAEQNLPLFDGIAEFGLDFNDTA